MLKSCANQCSLCCANYATYGKISELCLCGEFQKGQEKFQNWSLSSEETFCLVKKDIGLFFSKLTKVIFSVSLHKPDMRVVFY